MEQEYRLSRRIIAILTVIISFIVFINEDISVKLVGICLFTGIALFISYLGTKVSQRMIQIGDKISGIVLRFLYYVLLLVLILAIVAGFWFLVNLFYDSSSHSGNFATALGEAILLVFIGASFFVFLLIPYLQTLIVLFLRKKTEK